MREHDQRALAVGGRDRSVLVKLEIGEERQVVCRRFVVDDRRIEHRHGKGALAVMVVGEFDLLDADLVGLVGSCWINGEERAVEKGEAKPR